MTPIEIAEYKQRWKAQDGNPVRVHSDLDVQCKNWCRKNLKRHEWSMTSYTNVYEHTFYFEHLNTSQQFEHEFYNWVQA